MSFKVFASTYCLLIVLILTSCRVSSPNYSSDKVLHTSKAMVSSAHPLASDAGVEILKQGGNAIDAAIAVQFALAVVYPRAGNIGGGGFMVYRDHSGAVDALDFREMAPRLAHRDMYLDTDDHVIPGLSRNGGLSVGVPGSVYGMVEAHKKYGKAKWESLLDPAIRLASKGFQLTQLEVDRLNKFKPDFIKYNEAIAHTPSFPFVKNAPWKLGDVLVQEALAETLRQVAYHGSDGFYKGLTAQALLSTVQANAGIMTQLDLDDYVSYWRKPIITDYRGHKIISMPPPSSGGIALTQLLEIMEHFDLSDHPYHSAPSIHRMAEAERMVFADRAKHLGDADYYPVPIDSLLSPKYLAGLSASIPSDTARSSQSIFAKAFHQDLESYETTHFSIVDDQGNAISLTTTLNTNYGSKVYVADAGFFLNNEMDDFSAKPGVPNVYGLIGNEANAIEPGKRMLSSMTPTIVEKDGSFFAAVGSPGGSTIITSVFQIIVNMVDYGMSLDKAVEAPRFHHQWLPDQITLEENRFDPAIIEELKAKGHTIKTAKYIGLVDAVAREEAGWIGVGDNRGDDDAEGY